MKRKQNYFGSSNQKPSQKMEITREEEEEIQNSFNLFDSDQNGYLDKHEFKICLRSLGFVLNKEEIDYYFGKYNMEEINYEIFFKIIKEKYLERDPMEEIQLAFNLFDSDKTKKISLNNLKKVCRELGEHISERELNAMINEFDTDSDGQISLQEFINIMKE